MFIQPVPSSCGSVHAVRVGDMQPSNSSQRSRLNFVLICRSKATAWKVGIETPTEFKMRRFVLTMLSFCVNRVVGEAVTW